MEQDGKPWLREISGKPLFTTPIAAMLGWLLLVYGFGDSYEEALIRVLRLTLAVIIGNGAFYLVTWLWTRWRTR